MMTERVDAAHCLERARDERAKAANAETDEAALIHNQMADAYEEKARQLTGGGETD